MDCKWVARWKNAEISLQYNLKKKKNKENKSIRKTYEIDFLATKGNKTFYVQVANDISKSETLEREKRPYLHLKDPIQKVLVVNKPFKEMRDPEGYILIGISDFLLRFIK